MTGEGAPVVTVRDASASDAERIARIWETGWHDAHDGNVPDALARYRTSRSFADRAPGLVPRTRVAVVAGEVVGFATVVDDQLDQLYVDAAARGSGVAAALLADAARVARAAGHARPWLAVAPGNARARRFHERHGWSDDGPLDHRVEVEADVVVAVPCRRYVLADPAASAGAARSAVAAAPAGAAGSAGADASAGAAGSAGAAAPAATADA